MSLYLGKEDLADLTPFINFAMRSPIEGGKDGRECRSCGVKGRITYTLLKLVRNPKISFTVVRKRSFCRLLQKAAHF